MDDMHWRIYDYPIYVVYTHKSHAEGITFLRTVEYDLALSEAEQIAETGEDAWISDLETEQVLVYFWA